MGPQVPQQGMPGTGGPGPVHAVQIQDGVRTVSAGDGGGQKGRSLCIIEKMNGHIYADIFMLRSNDMGKTVRVFELYKVVYTGFRELRVYIKL